MHRRLTFLFRGFAVLTLLTTGSLIAAAGAAAGAAAPAVTTLTIGTTTTCSNNYLTDVAGLGIICQVTVVNTITTSGGSATVTVHECHGPAGPVPVQTDCSTVTMNLGSPVSAVTQCNGSINGGGTTLRCSVVVTNNFIGLDPGASPVSVNQCVGSATTPSSMICQPYPANTTGAAITQCNGTANGGGGNLTCTATGTMASAHAVTINQCNGSSNGGGDLVICSANVANNAISAPTPTLTANLSPTPTSTANLSPTPGRTATPPPTTTVSDGSSNNSTPLFALMILLAFGGLGLAAVVTQRRSIRR